MSMNLYDNLRTSGAVNLLMCGALLTGDSSLNAPAAIHAQHIPYGLMAI
ncbi:MAG: hypothetical protein N3F07_01420 [Candidatus Micrarchaeota archaeon]|nr:hypothetical protein [Candidatus Micrarchaeota archaeon]